MLSILFVLINFSGGMRNRKKKYNKIHRKTDNIHPKIIKRHKSIGLRVRRIAVNSMCSKMCVCFKCAPPLSSDLEGHTFHCSGTVLVHVWNVISESVNGKMSFVFLGENVNA